MVVFTNSVYPILLTRQLADEFDIKTVLSSKSKQKQAKNDKIIRL